MYTQGSVLRDMVEIGAITARGTTIDRVYQMASEVLLVAYVDGLRKRSTKPCPKCGGEMQRRMRAKGGYQCATCSAAWQRQRRVDQPEHVHALDKKSKIKHQVKVAARTSAYRQRTFRERNYGLSYTRYLALHAQQNGACAICKKPVAVLAVDHDHESKEIRGLLCRRCNSGLGMFGDSIQMLVAALEYLRDPPATKVPEEP